LFPANRRLLEHLLPASLCVGALLALGLTPFFVSWQSECGFACPTQYDVSYYLQLAAQPYYSHALYLSDPMVKGGASFYPWLQYIPFVCLTRWLGLPVFWIQILWTTASALGTGLTLYLFLWLVCRNRWLAAGITICIWADIDLDRAWFAHRPLFAHQIYLLTSDLINRLRGQRLLPRPRYPWQWRLTNMALDLPFTFLQLIVTSIACEHPSRRNLALSGLVFALTFYVYFYLWTMIAAGLCLALIVDRHGRRTYAWTLALGVALGWPQIVHDYLVRGALSAEGLKYFGLTASPIQSLSLLNDSPYSHPYLVLAELAILGAWVIRRKLSSLVLAWSMSCAGVCLSLVDFVTDIYIHNYHWAWLAVPVMQVMTVAVALDLITLWNPRPRIRGWVYTLFVSAYLAGGIYLIASIQLLDSGVSGGSLHAMTIYSEYNRQRLVPGVKPLRPNSVIAGDADFVDLAATAEQQRPLAGHFLRVNMVIGDDERRIRQVLDLYISGINRNRAAVLLNEEKKMSPEQLPVYLHTFDEVARDPERYIDDFNVRYLVLPATQRPPTFSGRWDLIQPGPFWQIWERMGSGAERQSAGGTASRF
jgi:hypothetical protein